MRKEHRTNGSTRSGTPILIFHQQRTHAQGLAVEKGISCGRSGYSAVLQLARNEARRWKNPADLEEEVAVMTWHGTTQHGKGFHGRAKHGHARERNMEGQEKAERDASS